MSALRVILAALLDAPAVTAIVADRIWPTVAERGAAKPYVVVSLAGEADGYTLAGANRWPERSFSTIAVGRSSREADELGEAAVAALRDASGTYGGHEAVVFREPGGLLDYSAGEEAHRRVDNFRVRFRGATYVP